VRDYKMPVFKYLVAFADTEGVHGKNGLWSLTTVIKALVSSTDNVLTTTSPLKFIKELDSVHTFNTALSAPTTNNRALSSHYDAIHYNAKKEGACGICICFWNASHDKRELSIYEGFNIDNPDFYFHYVDMIKFAKTKAQFNSYRLSSLIKTYQITARQTHTSLYDVLHMLEVLSCIVIDHSSVKKKLTIPEVKKILSIVSTKKMMKNIVESDFFLMGIEDSGQRPVVDTKYEFFKLDDVEYKIRSGFRKSKNGHCRGYGLYMREGSKYVSIRKPQDKKNVIDEYLERAKTAVYKDKETLINVYK